MTLPKNACVCRSTSDCSPLSWTESRIGACLTTSSWLKHATSNVSKVNIRCWLRWRVRRGRIFLPLLGASKEMKGCGSLENNFSGPLQLEIDPQANLVSSGTITLNSSHRRSTKLSYSFCLPGDGQWRSKSSVDSSYHSFSRLPSSGWGWSLRSCSTRSTRSYSSSNITRVCRWVSGSFLTRLWVCKEGWTHWPKRKGKSSYSSSIS